MTDPFHRHDPENPFNIAGLPEVPYQYLHYEDETEPDVEKGKRQAKSKPNGARLLLQKLKSLCKRSGSS